MCLQILLSLWEIIKEHAYPELQIAYLEKELHKDGGEPWLYSVLINGTQEYTFSENIGILIDIESVVRRSP